MASDEYTRENTAALNRVADVAEALHDQVAGQTREIMGRKVAAKYLDIPEDSLKTLAEKGEIPYSYIGGKMKFTLANLKQYIDRIATSCAPAAVELTDADHKRYLGD